MKHFCYYDGGILQEQSSSKDMARRLIMGKIQADEKVLDMATGMWVPITQQAEIMSIVLSMRKVQKKKNSFLGECLKVSFDDEQAGMDDPFIPEFRTFGIIPLYSWKQLFYVEYYIFGYFRSIYLAYRRWRGFE